jgi:hypothetical protein
MLHPPVDAVASAKKTWGAENWTYVQRNHTLLMIVYHILQGKGMGNFAVSLYSSCGMPLHCKCKADRTLSIRYNQSIPIPRTEVIVIGKFQIPSLPPTTNKTIRFPHDIIERVDQIIQGNNCTLSLFSVPIAESTKMSYISDANVCLLSSWK